jgi:aspartate/methionine/tyrosine aminotransferase
MKTKDYTTICHSAPSEILALMALRERRKILQKNMLIINRNLKLFEEFCSQYSNLIEWHKPKAGTTAFPRLLGGEKTSDFCSEILKGCGVLLLPSAIFDFGESHFRIGFGRKNMYQALEVLDGYLSKDRMGQKH